METNEYLEREKQECNEFKELLKYMRECYDKMNDGDSNAVYEKDVIIGFGNRIAHAKGGAATYTALEYAITYILEQEYEYEEEEETPPVGKVVKSYEIFSTGGGFYSVLGQLVDGRWFTGETPVNGCWGFGLYETKDAANESMVDDMIGSIDGNTAKYVIMWNEIIDDYAKGGETHKDEAEKWRNAIIEEYMEEDE